MASGFRGVQLNQAALDRLLTSREGPVGREMARVGGYVTRAAQRLADERLEQRSGEYAAGFRTTTVHTAQGPRTIISNVSDHATFIEKGTRPHIIRPRKVGGFLVFEGRGGETVFAREVHHPGTHSYDILRDALRMGLREAGL